MRGGRRRRLRRISGGSRRTGKRRQKFSPLISLHLALLASRPNLPQASSAGDGAVMTPSSEAAACSPPPPPPPAACAATADGASAWPRRRRGESPPGRPGRLRRTASEGKGAGRHCRRWRSETGIQLISWYVTAAPSLPLTKFIIEKDDEAVPVPIPATAAAASSSSSAAAAAAAAATILCFLYRAAALSSAPSPAMAEEEPLTPSASPPPSSSSALNALRFLRTTVVSYTEIMYRK